MDKTNVKANPSTTHRYDTPNNKKHVIKFRVTAEEKASLELTCKLLNLSLSTFIRRAIHNIKIEKTVIVAGGGEETLTAVSILLAQCSRVGGNLNQLARHFNSGGADTEQIRAKLLDELADLTAFRLYAEKVLLITWSFGFNWINFTAFLTGKCLLIVDTLKCYFSPTNASYVVLTSNSVPMFILQRPSHKRSTLMFNVAIYSSSNRCYGIIINDSLI